MNLLFNVLYAAHANGTHHKLALDALRHLQCQDCEIWRSALLKHANVYIKGSKAPDKEFKDFRNHVLHVRDNYWGGAPEKVESWYDQLVTALRAGDLEDVAWNAGVLSHYFTDPIHPFHTAQSEAESNIHRAVEWSISKSYNELRKRGLEAGAPEITLPSGKAWLRDFLIAGAELANADYETLIAHYDFDIGVVDPPAGLNAISRDLVGRLLVYAACGYAAVLDRAIVEANVAPPAVHLTVETVLAGLQIPVKWVTRKMADANEAKLVASMYDELQATGRVTETLSEDDRTIRDLHAIEVQAARAQDHDAARRRRLQAGTTPESHVSSKSTGNFTANDVPAVGDLPVEPERGAVTSVPSIARTSSGHVPPAATVNHSEPKVYLTMRDAIEAAPSIGPKTASRLEAVGICLVQDLIDADPEIVAARLDVRHITPETLVDWQDQARLVMQVAGLRGTHAQLFVGAGFRTLEDVARAEPNDVLSAMLRFAGTRDGQRLLRDGSPPDIERVMQWVGAAEQALEAA